MYEFFDRSLSYYRGVRTDMLRLLGLALDPDCPDSAHGETSAAALLLVFTELGRERAGQDRLDKFYRENHEVCLVSDIFFFILRHNANNLWVCR